jgi:hypothetical protein
MKWLSSNAGRLRNGADLLRRGVQLSGHRVGIRSDRHVHDQQIGLAREVDEGGVAAVLVAGEDQGRVAPA